MQAYKDLVVWQKSVLLAVKIYQVTEKFPKSEIYGLTSQMRRAVVAIPSNIAEGSLRGHKNEYIQFLRVSFSSGGELETQLLVSLKIGFISEKDYSALNNDLQEVMKMLNRLINVFTRT